MPSHIQDPFHLMAPPSDIHHLGRYQVNGRPPLGWDTTLPSSQFSGVQGCLFWLNIDKTLPTAPLLMMLSAEMQNQTVPRMSSLESRPLLGPSINLPMWSQVNHGWNVLHNFDLVQTKDLPCYGMAKESNYEHIKIVVTVFCYIMAVLTCILKLCKHVMAAGECKDLTKQIPATPNLFLI